MINQHLVAAEVERVAWLARLWSVTGSEDSARRVYELVASLTTRCQADINDHLSTVYGALLAGEIKIT